MGKKLTTNDFIEKSKNIHKNKYDYSLSTYSGYHEKIKIICCKHGIFEQVVSDHLSGCGCPKCVGKTKTTEEFINECEKIHRKKYDFGKLY